jgi:hypothetical protein
MGSDISRYTFDPNKHYSGVRQQQGRVNLDADWNEQVDIAAHRVERETFDVIGQSGAPRDNAGFQIQPMPAPSLTWSPNTFFAQWTEIVDSNGSVEIAITAGISGTTAPHWPTAIGAPALSDGSSGLTWQLVGSDLTISPGRIYVEGLLCELEATPVPIENFTGDGTGAPGTQVQVSPTVVGSLELKVGQWVEISAQGSSAPAPLLVQITAVNAAAGSLTFATAVSAFGSPNTNPQLVRQVTYMTQPDYPSPPPPSGTTSIVYLDVWERTITTLEDPQILEVALGGPDTTTRTKTVWQVKLVDVSSVTGVNCSTSDSAIPPWEQVIQPSAAQLTTGVVQSASSGPCCLTSNTGYTGMENQSYRVEIHQAGAPMPSGTVPPITSLPSGTATFKWSRDNGSVSTAVTGITSVTNTLGNPASQLTVQSLGRDQVLGFAPGNWVEITDDWQELNGQPGELHQIDSISVSNQTITLNSPVSSASFPTSSLPATSGQTDPTRHTRLTRWDQTGQVYESDGKTVWVDLGATGSTGDIPVPPPGTTLILENGITVAFGLNPANGPIYTGDFWTFAARTANGSVEPLVQAYPRGVEHHYSRLGVIKFGTGLWTIQDCRQLFPPLTAPAIHVTATNWANDDLFADLFTSGLVVTFDSPVSQGSFPLPSGAGSFAYSTFIVTLEGPVSTTNPAAYSNFVLAGSLSVAPLFNNVVTWKPGISSSFLSQFSSLATQVRVRVTLKGGGIWSLAGDQYLDGQTFGQPSVRADGVTPCIFLPLPSGNYARSSDFESWFWLLTTELAVSSLTLSPTSVAVGGSSTGTITLNGTAPAGGVNITLSNSSPSVATVQATVLVPAGSTSATFTVTGTALGTATITATGTSASATLTVAALAPASLTLSPTSVVGGNPSTGTVTLNGPAPATGASVGLSSSNPNFASVQTSVLVPSGSTSATFTINTTAFSVAIIDAKPIEILITASYPLEEGVSITANLSVSGRFLIGHGGIEIGGETGGKTIKEQ